MCRKSPLWVLLWDQDYSYQQYISHILQLDRKRKYKCPFSFDSLSKIGAQSKIISSRLRKLIPYLLRGECETKRKQTTRPSYLCIDGKTKLAVEFDLKEYRQEDPNYFLNSIRFYKFFPLTLFFFKICQFTISVIFYCVSTGAKPRFSQDGCIGEIDSRARCGFGTFHDRWYERLLSGRVHCTRC